MKLPRGFFALIVFWILIFSLIISYNLFFKQPYIRDNILFERAISGQDPLLCLKISDYRMNKICWLRSQRIRDPFLEVLERFEDAKTIDFMMYGNAIKYHNPLYCANISVLEMRESCIIESQRMNLTYYEFTYNDLSLRSRFKPLDIELYELAIELNDPGFCENISDIRVRGYCIGFAGAPSRNHSICYRLRGSHSDTCINIMAYELQDPILCWNISAKHIRDSCFGNLAKLFGDPSFCDPIEGFREVHFCREYFDKNPQKARLCKTSSATETEYAECIMGLALANKDSSFCGYVPSGKIQSPVLYPEKALQNETINMSYEDACHYALAIEALDDGVCDGIKISAAKQMCNSNVFSLLEASKGIKNGDISRCFGIISQASKDSCHHDVAVEAMNPRICEKINSSMTRGRCYRDIISVYEESTTFKKGDISVCDDFPTDPNYRRSCFLAITARMTNALLLCEGIADKGDKDRCLYESALIHQDRKLCLAINNESVRPKCFEQAYPRIRDFTSCDEKGSPSEALDCIVAHATEQRFGFLCERLFLQTHFGSGHETHLRSPLPFNDLFDCYLRVAMNLNDESLCDQITYSNKRTECFANLALNLLNESLCDRMLYEGSRRQRCKANVAYELNDTEMCERLEYVPIVECIGSIAGKTNNIGLCDFFEEDFRIDRCYRHSLTELKNITVSGIIGICDIIEDELKRDECVRRYARIRSDTGLCDYLSDSLIAAECFGA